MQADIGIFGLARYWSFDGNVIGCNATNPFKSGKIVKNLLIFWEIRVFCERFRCDFGSIVVFGRKTGIWG
jgi:hypothetical protein